VARGDPPAASSGVGLLFIAQTFNRARAMAMRDKREQKRKKIGQRM
jgi:hypothetical protein